MVITRRSGERNVNFLMKEYGKIVRLKQAGDAESAFLELKDLGFSCCQLVYKPRVYTDDDARIIREAAAKLNVRIVSLFAGYNDNYTKYDMYEGYKTAGINSKKYGRKRLAYVKAAASFAKSMGIEDVLIHAGFIANNPFSKEYKYMKKCLMQFAGYCKDIGVNVLLETGGESPVTLLRIIEDIGLGNLYANLDTANLIMYGFGNPADAVLTLNKYIKSMHIKDGMPPTSPNVLGAEMPVGKGFVDFKRVFAELEKIGYEGPLIIEREIPGEQQIQDIKAAIHYLNTYCAESSTKGRTS